MKVRSKLMVLVAFVMLPLMASAQGRIAVVNLEEAILQTDFAQQRLAEFEQNEDFTADREEFESLRTELEKLAQDFQRDQAAMSEDQKVAVRQKIASKNADLEYVAKKLQSMQQHLLQVQRRHRSRRPRHCSFCHPLVLHRRYYYHQCCYRR